MVAALVVLAACARSAAVLLVYPFDWAPDEGLVLDYARRLAEAPRTLYAKAVIPTPSGYTPLLPLLLAPLVRDEPFFGARLLALAWTAGAGLALFVLVRRRSGPGLALAAVALMMAPRDFSVWLVLVRFDGLMIALWFAAATALLPARLQQGADRLSNARLWTGAVLLLACVLAKPTAVVHGAPLVLGWFLVDRASAWKLSAAMLALGLAALGVLQWASDGGFLWIMRMWGMHPPHPGLFSWIVSDFLGAHALLLVLLLVAVVWGWRRGAQPFRDGAWLLVLGGLAILPTLTKAGAFTNYLLPLYCALVAVACRLWPTTPSMAILVPAALALSLLARPYRLPTSADAATSAAFYSFVRERGQPLLATRPEYAYYVLHQPVEAEGSGFPYFVASRVPGTEQFLDRVRRRYYRLIVAVPYFWPNDPDYVNALEDGYAIIARCTLGYFYGPAEFVLFLPRGESAQLRGTAEARCRAAAPPPPSAVGDAP